MAMMMSDVAGPSGPVTTHATAKAGHPRTGANASTALAEPGSFGSLVEGLADTGGPSADSADRDDAPARTGRYGTPPDSRRGSGRESAKGTGGQTADQQPAVEDDAASVAMARPRGVAVRERVSQDGRTSETRNTRDDGSADVPVAILMASAVVQPTTVVRVASLAPDEAMVPAVGTGPASDAASANAADAKAPAVGDGALTQRAAALVDQQSIVSSAGGSARESFPVVVPAPHASDVTTGEPLVPSAGVHAASASDGASKVLTRDAASGASAGTEPRLTAFRAIRDALASINIADRQGLAASGSTGAQTAVAGAMAASAGSDNQGAQTETESAATDIKQAAEQRPLPSGAPVRPAGAPGADAESTQRVGEHANGIDGRAQVTRHGTAASLSLSGGQGNTELAANGALSAQDQVPPQMTVRAQRASEPALALQEQSGVSQAPAPAQAQTQAQVLPAETDGGGQQPATSSSTESARTAGLDARVAAAKSGVAVSHRANVAYRGATVASSNAATRYPQTQESAVDATGNQAPTLAEPGAAIPSAERGAIVGPGLHAGATHGAPISSGTVPKADASSQGAEPGGAPPMAVRPAAGHQPASAVVIPDGTIGVTAPIGTLGSTDARENGVVSTSGAAGVQSPLESSGGQARNDSDSQDSQRESFEQDVFAEDAAMLRSAATGGASHSERKVIADAPSAPVQRSAHAARAIAAFQAVSGQPLPLFGVTASAGSVAGAGMVSGAVLDAELPTQIVQAIRVHAAAGLSQEARVTLNPGYLGEMTVGIRLDGTSVVASLHASSADVRDWIRANEMQLRQSLADQGLHLEQLVVSEEEAAAPDRHAGQPQQDQQQAGQDRERRRARSNRDNATFELLL